MLSIYKPATTRLQGVSHLVHTCVLEFDLCECGTGKVKLLLNLTTVLCNTVGGQCVQELH